MPKTRRQIPSTKKVNPLNKMTVAKCKNFWDNIITMIDVDDNNKLGVGEVISSKRTHNGREIYIVQLTDGSNYIFSDQRIDHTVSLIPDTMKDLNITRKGIYNVNSKLFTGATYAFEKSNYRDYIDHAVPYENATIQLDLICQFDISLESVGGALQNSEISGDNNNHCLFVALDKFGSCLSSQITPGEFKTRICKTKFSDPVHVDKISKVEKFLKVNIRVVGDVQRMSTTNYRTTITLDLTKSHYNFIHAQNKSGIIEPSKDYYRKLAYHAYKNVGKTMSVSFDHEYTSNADLYKAKQDGTVFNLDQFGTLTDFQTVAAKFKEIGMNISTAGKFSSLVLWAYARSARNRFDVPEVLSLQEEDVIRESMRGGWIDNKVRGNYVDYVSLDLNSAYPWAMNQITHPIKAGEFIENATDFKQYGFYEVYVVQNSENHKCWFTHYYLQLKTMRNEPFELTGNAYVYTPDKREMGRRMFGNYIDTFREWKMSDDEPALKNIGKQMLNNLHGVLSKKNKISHIVDLDGDLQEIPDKYEIQTMKRYDESTISFDLHDKSERYYKFDFIRGTPFIYDYVKLKIQKTIIECGEQPKRIYVDSIVISREAAKKIKTSTEMGGWKIEHSGNVFFNGLKPKWY